MAITRYEAEPGFGTLLGGGVSSGIAESLKLLAEQKMEDLSERQKEARQRKKIEGIRQAFGLGVPTSAPPPQIEPPSTGLDALSGLQGLGAPAGGAILPDQGPPPEFAQPKPQPGQLTPEQTRSMQDEMAAATMSPDQYLRYQENEKRIQQRYQIAEQKREQRDRLAQQKIDARKQEQITKETFKSYENLKEAADAAEKQIPLLLEYKRLKDEGSPASPMLNTIKQFIAKGVFGKDANVDWSLGTTEQKQRKITSQLLVKILKGIKGRPNEFLIREIGRGTPNVFTDLVTQEYIVNAGLYQAYYEAAGLKIAHKIMNENNGFRPANFDFLVQEGLKRAEKGLIKEFLPGLTGKL